MHLLLSIRVGLKGGLGELVRIRLRTLNTGKGLGPMLVRRSSRDICGENSMAAEFSGSGIFLEEAYRITANNGRARMNSSLS
jgi:hypothetical protein